MQSREIIGRPMEILLIEDSLVSARLTIGSLKNSGIEHRMTWLANGDEAIEFLHRQGKYTRAPQPDLVLLDLMLPGKPGKEILRHMRADAELQSVPVVIMTGSTSDSVIALNLLPQVQGFLTKPIDQEAFVRLMEQLKDYWKADMILPTPSCRAVAE